MSARVAAPGALLVAALLVTGPVVGAFGSPGAVASRAVRQGPQGAAKPLGEGPLGNDVFLPTSDAAARALAAGDEALAKSRDDALEAWKRALAESERFEAAPIVSPGVSPGTATPRGSEPVELAVARRLRAAGAEVARAWRDRFEAGADAARVSAGDDAVTLARVERSFPMTRAGARAALALADRAYETGESIGAATWLDRARSHADPADRPLAEAIERRAKAFRRDDAEGGDGGWRRASGLGLGSTVALAPESPSETTTKPREGIEPGLALLADGRVCVQGSSSVHFVDDTGRTESLDLPSAVRGHGWVWLAPFAEPGERWLLAPAALGNRVFLVAGRAANSQGNALLAVEARAGSTKPELAWGYSDAGFLAEDGSAIPIDKALGPGLWEFEPGPVVVEGSLIVQARQWTAEKEERPSVDERSVRSWCLGLDPSTGATRWQRLVAVGAAGRARPQGPRGFARPAQPLAAQEGRVFAGTSVGAAAWIDAIDGRVTSTLRYRRAPEGSRTWRLSAPLVLLAGSPAESAGPGPVFWAPPDSDRGYLLLPEAGGELGGAFRIESRELGRDAAPFAASGSRPVLLAAGERTSFGCTTLATGARFDSVALPRTDHVPTRGLASEHRLLAADDRSAFLFDVDDELRLLASVRLPGREDDPLGSIAARGAHVYVAGERTLWILNAR